MKSMTGFGAASAPIEGGRMVVEVRSVNARFLDLKISLPREHQAVEGEVREATQGAIERGRVEVSVRREGPVRRRPKVEIDLELARAHAEAWRKVKKALDLDGDVDLGLLRGSSGDIVRIVDAPVDPSDEQPGLRRALAKALVAERLAARITSILGGQAPDPVRIVQEVAIAIERSDFTEEITRLASHVDAFRKLLRETAPAGKRIEFLLQEMLREVNTIGSKAGHLPVTQAVLAAKSELEKLREQAANVE